MKLPALPEIECQISKIGNHEWRVPRLLQLCKDLPVMDVPLDHLNVWNTYEKLSLREMVAHLRGVMDADLDYPIILDEDGVIMDGRHRVMKAIYLGHDTIKAVRFDENPVPDIFSEE